ncbi:unnamed protein product [Caenorhabditis auriculariae]|uniref:Uncharacterized protein n=1 Tax=Caenorhabditis auriculariae TaxID=2777116 RepID=A0A8S1HTY6_9PELO|nr:unnamed protein product [Caenorhabditis auriculariae]
MHVSVPIVELVELPPDQLVGAVLRRSTASVATASRSRWSINRALSSTRLRDCPKRDVVEKKSSTASDVFEALLGHLLIGDAQLSLMMHASSLERLERHEERLPLDALRGARIVCFHAACESALRLDVSIINRLCSAGHPSTGAKYDLIL